MATHANFGRRAHVPVALAAALTIGLTGVSSTAAQAESPESPQQIDAPSILYSAIAPKARIVKSGATTTLHLPARTEMTWFTDRPGRQAGRTDLGQVAATWSAVGFDTDPPNAALLLTDAKGRERTHVVTLGEPRRSGGRVSFEVTVVEGGVEAGHAHIHGLRRGAYASARMFIDDAATPPCPSLVTTAIECLMTEQPVALRSMSGVGSVSPCGIETEDVQWQIQATFAAVDAGRIVQEGPLFANGRQIPGCDTPEQGVVTVFPSTSAVAYTQITLTNQSFVAGESTMGPGGVPSNPSWSPILVTYTIAAE